MNLNKHKQLIEEYAALREQKESLEARMDNIKAEVTPILAKYGPLASGHFVARIDERTIVTYDRDLVKGCIGAELTLQLSEVSSAKVSAAIKAGMIRLDAVQPAQTVKPVPVFQVKELK